MQPTNSLLQAANNANQNNFRTQNVPQIPVASIGSQQNFQGSQFQNTGYMPQITYPQFPSVNQPGFKVPIPPQMTDAQTAAYYQQIIAQQQAMLNQMGVDDNQQQNNQQENGPRVVNVFTLPQQMPQQPMIQQNGQQYAQKPINPAFFTDTTKTNSVLINKNGVSRPRNSEQFVKAMEAGLKKVIETASGDANNAAFFVDFFMACKMTSVKLTYLTDNQAISSRLQNPGSRPTLEMQRAIHVTNTIISELRMNPNIPEEAYNWGTIMRTSYAADTMNDIAEVCFRANSIWQKATYKKALYMNLNIEVGKFLITNRWKAWVTTIQYFSFRWDGTQWNATKNEGVDLGELDEGLSLFDINNQTSIMTCNNLAQALNPMLLFNCSDVRQEKAKEKDVVAYGCGIIDQASYYLNQKVPLLGVVKLSGKTSIQAFRQKDRPEFMNVIKICQCATGFLGAIANLLNNGRRGGAVKQHQNLVVTSTYTELFKPIQ